MRLCSKYDEGFPSVLKRALTACEQAGLDLADVDQMSDASLFRAVDGLGTVGIVALRSYVAGIAGREPRLIPN